MAQPARPDENDSPPPPTEDPPGAMVWAIAGFALVLAYVGFLVLMRPGG
jgi:hypothetical protein